MNVALLPSLICVLPLIALPVQLALAKQKCLILSRRIQLVWCLLFVILSALFFVMGQPLQVLHIANWPAPYGIALVFDHLSRLMLLVFAIAISCITVFSFQDNMLDDKRSIFFVATWLLSLAIIGAVSTCDIFNLYVWSEVMLVSAFILLSSTKLKNTRSVYQYAIFNISGTLCMLLAIALLYGVTGNLNGAVIAQFLQGDNSRLALPAVTLFLLGLGIKGGVFPFYFWLPTVYPDTSPSSTMLLSSLVTKVIMLVMLRLLWLWQPLQSTALVAIFVVLSCCTMFFGVMGAANEYRLRHILSFHIISQLGYVLFAIFIPSMLAIVAMLYFLIHNIFVKTHLLMTAGIVEQHYGSSELSRLGSVLQASPVLAVLFFVSAMSLAGVPPLSGFWAKLLILKVAFVEHFYWALVVALLVSVLTLYSMIKIWRYVYCEATPAVSGRQAFRLTATQWGALLPLFVIPVILGIYPQIILPGLQLVANQLYHPELMVNAILGGVQ